jgi:hypothetical protein
MSKRRFVAWTIPGVLVATAATAILALTFAGGATGQSPTISFVTVDGAGFTPDDNTCGYDRDNYSGLIRDHDGCAMEGGIQLPDRSIVVGVWVFYDSQEGGGRPFHLEASDHTGDHTDIAALDLPTCSNPQFNDPCVAFQLTGFELPLVLNAFAGYGGWLGGGDPDFILYRVVVAVITPAGGAGAAVSPLTPRKPPKPSKNPH